MKVIVIFFISISVFTVNSAFADCAPATLQHHYDSSDAVFHGTLISAQYEDDKSSPTSWTFAIQESFKGIDSKEVIVKNTDKYGERFKQGLDYLVFAEDNQQQLEFHLCNFQYYAFPTIVDMVSHLDEPSNPYGNILQNQLDRHLTEIEKIQLEKHSENFANERQKERDRLFGQAMLIGIPSTIGIGVAVMWIKTMRKK